MAAVFAHEKPAFDRVWSSPDNVGAHHYARPLLPLMASTLSRVAPVIRPRWAFSALDVVAAWVVACALMWILSVTGPELRHPWLAGALFLTGFPQVDWGYHILTDTVGYATAFISAITVWTALEWDAGRPGGARKNPGLAALLLAEVFIFQSLAFLARETAWMVPLVCAWLLTRRPRISGFGVAVIGVLLFAIAPRQIYLARTGISPIAIPFAPAVWLDPGYLLDFLVKSAVAFNVMWVAAILGARSGGLRSAPPLLTGWAVAGLAYMAAGYAHNSIGQPGSIGYPLRLTYVLFPLVYYLVARAVEARVRPEKAAAVGAALVALNGAIAVTGTLLDRGATGVTVPALIQREGAGDR